MAEGSLGNGVTRREFTRVEGEVEELRRMFGEMRIAAAVSHSKIALIAAGVGAVVSMVLGVLGGLILWLITSGNGR